MRSFVPIDTFWTLIISSSWPQSALVIRPRQRVLAPLSLSPGRPGGSQGQTPQNGPPTLALPRSRASSPRGGQGSAGGGERG